MSGAQHQVCGKNLAIANAVHVALNKVVIVGGSVLLRA